ncbi:hypothetical protein EJ04DRAFT_562456 [Polyplosphaeria fusca]|uniref:Uncharacterized protein n=1 Tax=Polyplosphaeria fusca TaxID=682080 RepID=A0A9P4R1I0_9PLEO|nr:hypothetical protein EJ04DRAFT_562456 [Polyplosphaeria fusca]
MSTPDDPRRARVPFYGKETSGWKIKDQPPSESSVDATRKLFQDIEASIEDVKDIAAAVQYKNMFSAMIALRNHSQSHDKSPVGIRHRYQAVYRHVVQRSKAHRAASRLYGDDVLYEIIFARERINNHENNHKEFSDAQYLIALEHRANQLEFAETQATIEKDPNDNQSKIFDAEASKTSTSDDATKSPIKCDSNNLSPKTPTTLIGAKISQVAPGNFSSPSTSPQYKGRSSSPTPHTVGNSSDTSPGSGFKLIEWMPSSPPEFDTPGATPPNGSRTTSDTSSSRSSGRTEFLDAASPLAHKPSHSRVGSAALEASEPSRLALVKYNANRPPVLALNKCEIPIKQTSWEQRFSLYGGLGDEELGKVPPQEIFSRPYVEKIREPFVEEEKADPWAKLCDLTDEELRNVPYQEIFSRAYVEKTKVPIVEEKKADPNELNKTRANLCVLSDEELRNVPPQEIFSSFGPRKVALLEPTEVEDDSVNLGKNGDQLVIKEPSSLGEHIFSSSQEQKDAEATILVAAGEASPSKGYVSEDAIQTQLDDLALQSQGNKTSLYDLVLWNGTGVDELHEPLQEDQAESAGHEDGSLSTEEETSSDHIHRSSEQLKLVDAEASVQDQQEKQLEISHSEPPKSSLEDPMLPGEAKIAKKTGVSDTDQLEETYEEQISCQEPPHSKIHETVLEQTSADIDPTEESQHARTSSHGISPLGLKESKGETPVIHLDTSHKHISLELVHTSVAGAKQSAAQATDLTPEDPVHEGIEFCDWLKYQRVFEPSSVKVTAKVDAEHGDRKASSTPPHGVDLDGPPKLDFPSGFFDTADGFLDLTDTNDHQMQPIEWSPPSGELGLWFDEIWGATIGPLGLSPTTFQPFRSMLPDHMLNDPDAKSVFRSPVDTGATVEEVDRDALEGDREDGDEGDDRHGDGNGDGNNNEEHGNDDEGDNHHVYTNGHDNQNDASPKEGKDSQLEASGNTNNSYTTLLGEADMKGMCFIWTNSTRISSPTEIAEPIDASKAKAMANAVIDAIQGDRNAAHAQAGGTTILNTGLHSVRDQLLYDDEESQFGQSQPTPDEDSELRFSKKQPSIHQTSFCIGNISFQAFFNLLGLTEWDNVRSCFLHISMIRDVFFEVAILDRLLVSGYTPTEQRRARMKAEVEKTYADHAYMSHVKIGDISLREFIAAIQDYVIDDIIHEEHVMDAWRCIARRQANLET